MVFSSQSSFTRPSWRTLHLTPRRYISSPTRESLPGRLGCWTLNSISQRACSRASQRWRRGAAGDCHGPRDRPNGLRPAGSKRCNLNSLPPRNCQLEPEGGAPRPDGQKPIVLPRLCLRLRRSISQCLSVNRRPESSALTIPQAYSNTACGNNRASVEPLIRYPRVGRWLVGR